MISFFALCTKRFMMRWIKAYEIISTYFVMQYSTSRLSFPTENILGADWGDDGGRNMRPWMTDE